MAEKKDPYKTNSCLNRARVLANRINNGQIVTSFGAMNQRIFSLELFICIHEILQITYLAKTASEISNTLVLKGLNYGIQPAKTKVFFFKCSFFNRKIVTKN